MAKNSDISSAEPKLAPIRGKYSNILGETRHKIRYKPEEQYQKASIK